MQKCNYQNNYLSPSFFLLSKTIASSLSAAFFTSSSIINCPPVKVLRSSVNTLDTTLLPPMNGDIARCNGNPKANPNAPSAKACSSNHCGAERTNGSCGKSIQDL